MISIAFLRDSPTYNTDNPCICSRSALLQGRDSRDGEDKDRYREDHLSDLDELDDSNLSRDGHVTGNGEGHRGLLSEVVK